MQRERVKAHELRKKDEAELVAELTKYRVCFISHWPRLERVGFIES